jgi:DNA-binding CsgD family transcriptional regulator/Lon protease-like protein
MVCLVWNGSSVRNCENSAQTPGRRVMLRAKNLRAGSRLFETPVTASKEKFEIKKLPMMPIRDAVIFPHMMTAFVVGRESSVRALEEALTADKNIFLATQHDASVDEPKFNEIYQVGTLVIIVQSLKLPDGNIKVLVEGVERGKILQVTETEGFMQATVRLARYATKTTPQIEAGMQRVSSLFDQYVKLCQSQNHLFRLFDKLGVSSRDELYETIIAAVRMKDPAKLTDTIAANLLLFSIEEKQELLEILDPAGRLSRLGEMLDIKIKKPNMDPSIQWRRELDEMHRIIVAHLNHLKPPFSASPRSASSQMNLSLLSKRELEVVRGLCEGLTNREIAERLGLSQHTIKNYLLRLFDKLGVSSRVELLFKALTEERQLEVLFDIH